MQPKQFRIPAQAASRQAKKILFMLVPLFIFATAVGVFTGHTGADNGKGDYTALFISIPLTLVMLTYGVLKGQKRAKKQLSSYTLTFYANSIQREQADTPTINLYHSDIKEIIKMHDSSFYIRAKASADFIAVPATIEHYEEVQELLAEIMPLTSKGAYRLLGKYQLVLSLATLLLMGIVFYSTNKYVVAIGGIPLLGFLGWAFDQARRSNSIDKRTKKNLWWVVLVLFSIAGRMVAIWFQ
jgi:uncharacterized membrane protein